DYLDSLETIVRDVVAPAAQDVDASGRFPTEGVKALGSAGLLGLISATEVGGMGQSMRAASQVVERLARACGSTAMVVMMHYCGTSVIEGYGPRDVREAIARGEHLTTLAFSEAGSRSHFWSPLSTATRDGAGVRLDAKKSWITSAGHADSYVWSSRPVAAEGPMTLWLVPAGAQGLSQPGAFDGLGLRGNASSPVIAEGVTVPETAMLGEDGKGFDIAMSHVLPYFQVLSASVSAGLMEAVIEETANHLGA